MRLPPLALPLLLALSACGTLSPAPAPPAAPEAPRAPSAPQPSAPPPGAPQPSETPQVEPAPIDTAASAPRSRRPDAQIRFVPGSDRIDPASQQALAAIAQRWSRDKSLWIVLRGQPAAGGSREYAQARALQDSHGVEARLVELGVPDKRIRALAHGQRGAESGERRVDVFLDQFRP